MDEETNDEFNDVAQSVEHGEVEQDGALFAAPAANNDPLDSTDVAPTTTYAYTADVPVSVDVYTCPAPQGTSGTTWTYLDATELCFGVSGTNGTRTYLPENAYTMETVADHVQHVHIDYPLSLTRVDGTLYAVPRLTDYGNYIRLRDANDRYVTFQLPYGQSASHGDLTITVYPRGGSGSIAGIFFGTPFVPGYQPDTPAATVADLEARWHTLTDTEKSVASTLIGDAVAYLKRICPNYDDIPTDTLKSIVCAIVKRAMLSRDSSGISQQSETVGSFGVSYTWSNPTGDLYLTREERRQLGLGAQHAGGWEL